MNSPHPRSRRRSECKTQSKWRTEQARLSLHYDGAEETGEKRHHPSVEKLRKYFTRSYTVATAALTMTQYDSAANARPIRAALLTGGCLSEKKLQNAFLKQMFLDTVWMYIVRFLCDVPYRKSSAFRTQHIEIRKKRAIMFKIRSACPREVFWMSAQLWTKSGSTCCTIDKLPH